jgi:hypothetical protein
MFPGHDFITSTASENRPACTNDDFYWPLALAVTKNATINRFTTATIELLCTSVRSRYSSFDFKLQNPPPFVHHRPRSTAV